MPKHIVRLIVLILAFGTVALIAKWYFTAESFYKYGHYRADSVPEIAAQAVAFQTPRYCQPCHSEAASAWLASLALQTLWGRKTWEPRISARPFRRWIHEH